MIIFDLFIDVSKIRSHDAISAFDIAKSINSMVIRTKIQLSSVNDDTHFTCKRNRLVTDNEPKIKACLILRSVPFFFLRIRRARAIF